MVPQVVELTADEISEMSNRIMTAWLFSFMAVVNGGRGERKYASAYRDVLDSLTNEQVLIARRAKVGDMVLRSDDKDTGRPIFSASSLGSEVVFTERGIPVALHLAKLYADVFLPKNRPVLKLVKIIG